MQRRNSLMSEYTKDQVVDFLSFFKTNNIKWKLPYGLSTNGGPAILDLYQAFVRMLSK